MRQTNLQARISLLAALTLLASCNKPHAAPEPQKVPVASAATTPEPEPPSPAIDQSISTNVGDPAKFREVMTTLQQAVKNHDAAAVAALVSYPIDINPRTKNTLRLRTPEAFIAHYDSIITPHIADVIAKQKYDALFVNYQGAMFGSGELWIAGICRDKTCTQTDIKIRTIQNTAGASK